MKLKSLIIGSVAAAGLSTGAFAADLGVLTSLDVCDALGISGLTLSSDTNCLQISGGVDYRLRIGNFDNNFNVGQSYDSEVDPIAPGGQFAGGEYRENDWHSRSRAWLKVVGTANSDFGPASAIIGLRQVDEWRTNNEGYKNAVGGVPSSITGGDHTNGVILDEAYVRVGEGTVLMVGKRSKETAGSIVNVGDDNPYSFLFISETIDGGGILINADDERFGGHSIQITSDLGNGLSASVALENFDNQQGSKAIVGGASVVPSLGADTSIANRRLGSQDAGTAIGVVSYKGETITAHVSGVAFGVLDGDVEQYAIHAGATGSFDIFKVTAALGYLSEYEDLNNDVLTGLLSAEATFDLFKVALSGEFANYNDETDFGVGGRVTAGVSEGISLNLDAAYFSNGSTDRETTRVAIGAAAEVTETITLTAALGGYFGDGVQTRDGEFDEELYFGSVGAAWTPGGNFNSAIVLEANDSGAYRTQITASKTFN